MGNFTSSIGKMYSRFNVKLIFLKIYLLLLWYRQDFDSAEFLYLKSKASAHGGGMQYKETLPELSNVFGSGHVF